MISNRRFPLRLILMFGIRTAGVGALWTLLVYALYAYFGISALRVPFLPIATVGTAVAFYIGFKNNAAYERFWEGRKIWGGIVNASRTWGTCVMSYLPGDSADLQALRRRLIYRQLAWINAVRLQLRKTSRFFDKPAASTRRRLARHDEAMRNDWDTELSPFLSSDELAASKTFANAATHLLTKQGAECAQLLQDGGLDLFHQIALMDQVTEMYGLQGKAERIKHTPFPRQYAEYGRIFTWVFAALIPFGLLDVFADNIDKADTTVQTWMWVAPMVLSGALLTWVFNTMEGIADASEDPFERSMNDVPMNALCRTIEIDLRQMLGETDLPPKEPPIDGLLY